MVSFYGNVFDVRQFSGTSRDLVLEDYCYCYSGSHRQESFLSLVIKSRSRAKRPS